ncbi:22520_t:CDS:1, partial [Gigaspora margarita]
SLCKSNQGKTRSYWIRVGSKSNDWCPYEEGKIWRHRETQTHREDGHVTMGAEMGAMKLQAKEYSGLLATIRSWRGKEGFFPGHFC